MRITRIACSRTVITISLPSSSTPKTMSRRSTRRNYAEKIDSLQFDELEEEQEITRCVCGNDELNPDTMNPSLMELLLQEYQIKIDQGLFIQCDKCSVWQHGFCVGLFIDEDVPDKYWCEQCKPELHILIYEGNDSIRTLYKPVNEKRKKLIVEDEKSSKRKMTRKGRRNYDYDEQLQKAIRESVKDSGIEEGKPSNNDNDDDDSNTGDENDDDNNEDGNDKNDKNDKNDNDDSVTKNEPEEEDINGQKPPTTSTDSDNKPSNTDKTPPDTRPQVQDEGEEEDAEEERDEDDGNDDHKPMKKKPLKRVKKKDLAPKPKRTKPQANKPTFTKEELVNQPSKPRFVSDRSTIYELRKRINAILEWLNRSQLELDDERSDKSGMTNNLELMQNFDHNQKLMQNLTEQILVWEQKFGKYAP